MATEQTPEERAAAAAEALAAEGAAVTARSVRDRSGVRMALAAEAARAWNDQQSKEATVPEPPAAVQARFAALWREAVTLARGEFAEARTGWEARIAKAEEERNGTAEDLGKVEDERDKALKEATKAAEAVTTQRSRADKAEGRTEAIAAERNRLVEERDRLLADISELRNQVRDLEVTRENQSTTGPPLPPPANPPA
ncbi:DNA-binding protein [Arthrobacter sp. UYCo732]|uniref:DNA-binding protein n=1 Tax=Arthrobacter sp. UYCo732 TaxID=3156336 RepID=UPI0033931276